MKTILSTIALAAVSLAAMPLPAATLSLSNGGNLTANAGDTTGWGFTFISTDPLAWSVLTFSEFLPATPLGSYGDYIALPQTFYEAPPFTPVISPFDPANQLGIGEFILAPSAPAGSVISGTLRLHYDSYLGDPSVGALLVGLDNTLDAPVTITVNGQQPASTPEPPFLWLVGVCLAAGFAKRTSRDHDRCRTC